MLTEPIAETIARVRNGRPSDGAAALRGLPAGTIRDILSALPVTQALEVAARLPGEDASRSAAAQLRQYAGGNVGDFLEPLSATVNENDTVSAAIDRLVHHPMPEDVTYVYVVGAERRLVGVFGMRDLLLAKPAQTVRDIMTPEPQALTHDMTLGEASGIVMQRYLSRYPVVDSAGVPIGEVRGRRIMRRLVAEAGSQAGSLVGVARIERLGTPLLKAFRLRHPWLQVNLLTAFMAAFVVSLFEDTIARVVALAAFLPVLAGQSGNTGSQALAITLRGITLGEILDYPVARLLRKEIVLGALNGAAVGLVAAVAMWGYALFSGAERPDMLALVILLAMVVSCVASGIFGVLVPVTLRRFGADPAMASGIFLTTFTDILGMGLMLLLASLLV